jgi:phosphoglycolate phosphatase
MLTAAVFDLDGTLLDTPRAIVATFTAVLTELGRPAPDPGAVRATVGMPLDRAFRQLGAGCDAPSAVETYLALFRETVVPRGRELVFPGVESGLIALRDAGVPLAVATSKFVANARALLGSAGLLDLFAVVTGADQVSRPKPDPEMGWLVLDRLGVDPADAVMVGDTTHDVLMARAAGMPCIGVSYGVHDVGLLTGAGATWIAHSFDDVVRRIHPTTQERP